MGKYQKEKGKRGERELANLLKTFGFDCKRGQQYSGKNGDADVVGLPGIYIECKRAERLNLELAMNKVINDSSGCEQYPAVFHRKDRCEWMVTMRMVDWMKIYSGWRRKMIRKIEFQTRMCDSCGETISGTEQNVVILYNDKSIGEDTVCKLIQSGQYQFDDRVVIVNSAQAGYLLVGEWEE